MQTKRQLQLERRQFSRLPLAIPVFVRSKDENGKEMLEFANALNVSAGGALIALRRVLPPSSRVSLEIPSAPLGFASTLPKMTRKFSARALRASYSDGYHLVALKFGRPICEPDGSAKIRQGKSASRK
jgi:PilZ domain